MVKSLIFEFGVVNVFKNFVITIMKEGITVKPEYNKNLEEVADKYFRNRPFGYITYRKNSYAVDPMVYLQTSKIINLVAFAVVSVNGIKTENLALEKLFLKKPLKHFSNLDDAKNWVNKIVRQKKVGEEEE